MNKDEILSKSRKENKNKDLYTIEVQAEGAAVSAIAATILATVFFVVEILRGGGFNYGLYAIVFVIGAASWTFKAVRMKQKRDIVFAVLYVTATLVFSAAHIYQLLSM